MGCISSKILTRSGSLQEKKASYHGFQRSSSQLIEDIILSSSNSKTKPNGESQPTFLALLRSASSSSSAAAARKSRVDATAAEQSPASAATPAAAAKIETIDVSELLAGLEEDDDDEEEGHRNDSQENRGEASPRCVSDDGGAAGRARSFRTVEEFDALVITRSSGSPEQAAEPAPERDASVAPPESGSSEQEDPATASAAPDVVQDETDTRSGASSGHGDDAAAGAKRRARARQLRELSSPEAAAGFDFGKSGSLRDWLRGGGPIFSPGSYVTPKFGNAPADRSENAREEHASVFDPELVAQFELAMEELSVDEERVMREVLESLDAGEKREEAERLLDLELERPPNEQASPLVVYLQD